ncbi:serine hydrolase [Aeromicrobium sp.]|uniref:serine hydrolase domain-containing protein n=1 Tax=Aeromicrobium sp. TaxID=1871063 RepID=UPI0019C4877F|nr:serine hydrolase domain-containing protein [Aeromicrobium sp.]MBC7630304.1 beta-lactamase family protein [Aeromicrobium sp.]
MNAAVRGSYDPRFTALADLLHAHVGDGIERGASLCVIQDGEVLVDIWDGWSDVEQTATWQRDTITPVWSITKVMVNLAALVLIDRGELDPDSPVADYWPEFGAAGKQGVTVAQILGHTSGVSGWAQPVTVDDLYDWSRSTTMPAAQEPWWEPGTASGYHLLNQGHLVGEVIRRITGVTVGEFFAKEIAGPLGADFHIGLRPDDDKRVSPVSPPRQLDLDLTAIDPAGIAMRTLTGPFVNAREANTERWRRAEIPAANGHGNARSIARVQSLISHGGEVDGVRLLSPATIERIFDVQASGIDLVLGVQSTFGLGWALPEPATMPSVAAGRRCYWGGLGGSIVINDLDNRLTIAYAMNRMLFEYAPGTRLTRPCGDSRSDSYVDAIMAALTIETAS